MAGLNMVKVRCRVSIGGLVAGTPCDYVNHVLSFNVDKTRGQTGSCSVSMKIKRHHANFATSGGDITIDAGQNGANNRVFYGYIKSITISPCRENPAYILMNVSGVDALSKLDGKKYTRRCRSVTGPWVSIDGIAREGLRSGKLTYIPLDPYLEINGGMLNKQNNLVGTRAQGINTTPFEKLSTNVKNSTGEVQISYVESPTNKQQTTGQTQ